MDLVSNNLQRLICHKTQPTNIPPSPDDGSLEPKCYSSNWFLNKSLLLGLCCYKFFLYFVRFYSIIYFHIYIYIYIYRLNKLDFYSY